MDYLIIDDNGVIASFTTEEEAMIAFADPQSLGTPWTGDLKVVLVLAVRR